MFAKVRIDFAVRRGEMFSLITKGIKDKDM